MLITQSAGKFLKRKNSINLGGELIDFSVPVVMGIVNVTPDSFYDGGKLEDEKVLLAKVEKMISDGAGIIDVGGGDSFFVDHLLDLGYTDITVVDISSNAIERAKKRLGKKANLVKWIVADAAEFNPPEQYDFWHDRAAFHFLTAQNEILHYVNAANNAIKPNGILVIGTFSEQGPLKCSGIEIKQYSENSMTNLFAPYFNKNDGKIIDHETPFNTTQNFVFCSFTKK